MGSESPIYPSLSDNQPPVVYHDTSHLLNRHQRIREEVSRGSILQRYRKKDGRLDTCVYIVDMRIVEIMRQMNRIDESRYSYDWYEIDQTGHILVTITHASHNRLLV